jgi:putative ABC transport system permease protein
MALGAERRRILTMVLRQGMELAVAGIVLGLIGAFALTRVMAGLLFNVSTMDIATFSVVPFGLAFTAAVAILIPAMRATQVDPVVALRDE